MRNLEMLKRIGKINQCSDYVKALLGAIALSCGEIDNNINQAFENLFFDTANEGAIKHYEKEAGIIPAASQTLTDRASAIMAKWKSEGKVDIVLLQSIAGSWEYGTATIDFVNGTIQVTFDDTGGLPVDTEGVKRALGEVKPAHLPYSFVYTFYTWGDAKNKTWGQAGESTWYALKVR